MTRALPTLRFMARAMLVALLGLGSGVALLPLSAAPPLQDAPTPCVTVDIAGNRVGDLDCREQRMRETARRAQQAATASAKLARGTIPRGPAATGLATPAGANMRPSPLTGRAPPPPPVYSSPIAPPR